MKGILYYLISLMHTNYSASKLTDHTILLVSLRKFIIQDTKCDSMCNLRDITMFSVVNANLYLPLPVLAPMSADIK